MGKEVIGGRSTVRADLMLDCKVEVEALAYSPRPAAGGAR